MTGTGYNLFCPLAMACEVVEPRWTLLILLEMWNGSTRFNELRRDGLAVERTGVSLDEITSEPRQESLVRIIRSLARPELVTYDFDVVETDGGETEENTDGDIEAPASASQMSPPMSASGFSGPTTN